MGMSRMSSEWRADEVEQQVERALEGVEEHRQRLGRDVEVRGQLRHGLAADLRDRQRQVERRLLEPERNRWRRAWSFLAVQARRRRRGSWSRRRGRCRAPRRSSQANFTPSSCAAAVAALKKFSPRSSAAGALLHRAVALVQVLVRPGRCRSRPAAAPGACAERLLAARRSPAGEPTSEYGIRTARLVLAPFRHQVPAGIGRHHDRGAVVGAAAAPCAATNCAAGRVAEDACSPPGRRAPRRRGARSAE